MSLNKSQALNAARQYAQQSNPQAAIDLYQQIIEADPTDLNTINTLGDLYVNTGRVQDAITQFTRVADGYLQSGFIRKAIAVLKKILTLDPANIETGIRLADVYAQAGLPSEARRHYLQIADTYTRKGQMHDALRVYPKIVELDPSNASTRIKLGELYLREGLNDQAYEAFMTAAKQLAIGGESRRALNAYNEALAVKPDSVEASGAVAKLMGILNAAETEKRLRNAESGSATSGDTAKENTSASGTSDLRVSKPPGHSLEAADSAFVVQEISKAEILVAYGKVDQATSMLRNVLNKVPDNLEVHIKLKDVFLRTGMMSAAAEECRQLERIYRVRGEADRARDYGLRANRLAQLVEKPPSDLPPVKPRAVEKPEPRIDLTPSRIQSKPNVPVLTSRLGVGEVHPEQITHPVMALNAPASKAPTKLADVPPPIAPLNLVRDEKPSLVIGETKPDALMSLEPDNLRPAIAEVKPDALISLEPAVVEIIRRPADSSVSILQSSLATSTPVERKRGRFFAVSIAAGVLALLTAGAVVGGFVYDGHLDKQYETLLLAATSPTFPAPPPALVSEESQPVQDEESMTVVVTPLSQTDTTPRTQTTEPEVIEDSRPAPVLPASEPPRTVTRPSPTPPRTSLSSDRLAGTENRIPAGVPSGVPTSMPIDLVRPAEPPPKTVRQSPGVVLGGAVRRVDPAYPSAARQARQTGVVSVEVAIDEQGNVTSSRALSGPLLLRNAAVTAARGWKFKPPTVGGVPMRTTTVISFNFKL